MPVNLVKLAVRVESVRHLAEIQAARMEAARRQGLVPNPRHITRHMPRRAAELTSGGSIYWVIKGFIRCRQRILALERCLNAAGRPSCALVLDPGLVRTGLKSMKPFQGWRYFAPEAAPGDIGPFNADDDQIGQEMESELRDLGLL